MPLKFTPNLILKAKFSGVEKGKDLLDAQNKIKKMGEEQLDLEAELSFQKSRIEKALKKYHELGEVDTLIGYLNYIAALETELTAMGGDVRKCKANCNRKAIQITKKK